MNTIFNVQALLSLTDMMSGPLTKAQSKINSTKKDAMSFSDRMGVLAKQMTVFAMIAGGVLFGIGSSVASAGDFQAAISAVGAVSNATASEMAALESSALKLGKTTAFSAVQAAEGQKYLAMAGFDTTQTIAAMPGVLNLASAAQEDLGNTANIASNIMSGFGIEADKMPMIADQLTRTFTSSNTTLAGLGQTMANVAPVASAAGASLAEVSAMAGTLGNVGVDASAAGTHLKIMFTKLMAPTRMTSDALKKLGVSTRDSAGNMLPMFDVLQQIETATANMGTGDRGAALQKIFGGEAVSSATALLKQGVSSIRKFASDIENGSLTASTVATRQLDNLPGKLTLLSSAWEGLKISIGTVFLPVAEVLVSALTSIISVVSAVASHPIGKWLLMVAGILSTIVVAVTGFAGAWAGVSSALAIVGPMVAGLGVSVGALFWPVTLAVAAVTGLYVAWQHNFLGIRDITYSVFGFFQDYGMSILKALGIAIAVIATPLTALAAAAYGLYTAWQNNFLGIRDLTYSVIESIKGFFAGLNLYEYGVNMISTLTEGVKSMVMKPYEAVKGIFSKVSNLFSNSDAREGPLSTLTQNGRNILATMVAGIQAEEPRFSDEMSKALGKWETPSVVTHNNVEKNEKQQVLSISIDRVELPGVCDGQTFVEDLFAYVRAYG